MLTRIHAPGGPVGYRSSSLAAVGVPHLFTTRRRADGAPLDVGDLNDPALAATLRGGLGLGAGTCWFDARQVHGAHVVRAGECEERPSADGLVSEDPGRAVLVRTADCVPVLLARGDGAAVAAVHAGWRGLVAGVLPRAVEVLGPGPLVAAIGPCLSAARFEVGEEVADAFRAAELSEVVLEPAPGAGARPHVDLRRAAALQLARVGVLEIDVSDACTWDEPEDFYSYRRDVTRGGAPSTGRLAALIAPRPVTAGSR